MTGLTVSLQLVYLVLCLTPVALDRREDWKWKHFFEGTPLEQLSQREQSQQIGFVQQSPENQIVTDKVWHELAFGLESLGCETAVIRHRVAEMASFSGIEDWFYKNVSELSG